MSIDEEIIERLAGSGVNSQRRFPGGDISGASEVQLADGRIVVAKHGPVVDVEARMLKMMLRSKAPVPEVLACEDNVLLIERLPSEDALAGAAWKSLAEALSSLHSLTSDHYGWSEDYWLRDVEVRNSPVQHWPQFWSEKRLACHFSHLPKRLALRLEKLAGRLTELLPDQPVPSLLHGDLWGGNVVVSDGRVSGLIDPCAYFGDREVDAATLTIFDSPPTAFFEALELEDGWRERQPVYRLWTWLLHIRLFGESYRPAVERELGLLGF